MGGKDSTPDFGVWGPAAYRPVPSSWGADNSILEPIVAEDKKRKQAQTCNYMDVVSFKPDVSWVDQREADMQRGINLWVAVTSRWDSRCSFMRKLSEMQGEHEIYVMFAHVFSGRAPVTIRKRGLAILRVCDYLEKAELGQFPMAEITLYRFFCAEKVAGAPARTHGHHAIDGTLQTRA